MIDGTQTACYRPCMMTSLPEARDTPNLAPPPVRFVSYDFEQINEKNWCSPELQLMLDHHFSMSVLTWSGIPYACFMDAAKLLRFSNGLLPFRAKV